MRFFRPRPSSRSDVNARHLSSSSSVLTSKALALPSPSSTTAVFRIAQNKRMFYTRLGALPLPLDTEVAIKQFLDGGSRADAAERLGPTYTDPSGVIYEDEIEAMECLPLLLATESGADEVYATDTQLNAPSGSSGNVPVASAMSSSLSPSTPPAPSSPAQLFTPIPPRALFSIPARAHLKSGRGADGAVYVHSPLLSVPHPSINGPVMMQFSTSVVAVAAERGRKQRKWPALSALPFPMQPFGFEDSFVPVAAVRTPIAAAIGEAVEL
jgi:hypothetical protein